MLEEAAGLKQKMRSGEQTFGVSVPISVTSERLRTIVESGPYDFVWIDSQHSPLNEERVAEFCGMAEAQDVFVVLRIKHTRNAYLVGNYLDLGPCGVEVPQTETDATVAEAVEAFYYPPAGRRSYGGPARRGARGKDPAAYARWWNPYGVLCLQVESVAAVTRARQLAQPGVDCLTFGPVDLTFSLEAHPHHPFRTVDDCIQHVARAVEGTSTRVCVRNRTPEMRGKYADMGVTVFLEDARG